MNDEIYKLKGKDEQNVNKILELNNIIFKNEEEIEKLKSDLQRAINEKNIILMNMNNNMNNFNANNLNNGFMNNNFNNMGFNNNMNFNNM